MTAARLAAIPEIRRKEIPWAREDRTRPPVKHTTMAHSPVTPQEVDAMGGPTAGANLQELVYELPRPGAQGDGRYIPYTGGSLGWFENSGVSKAELPNDYQFFKVIDSDWVLLTQMERSGMRKDRRATPRGGLNPETAVTLTVGDRSEPAECKNVSTGGLCVQVNAELAAVYRGDPIGLQIHDKSGRNLLVEQAGAVAWVENSDQPNMKWTVGIAFSALAPSQAEMVLELTVATR